MDTTNPYNTPTSQPEIAPLESGTSSTVVKVLMWITWVLNSLVNALVIFSVHIPNEDASNWLSSDMLWILTGLILLVIALSLRSFAIPMIKNSWFKLLVFWIGLFFAQMIIITGLFMFISGQHLYLVLGTLALLAYCPRWIK